jgi:aryl-alcohol dehydrogenase-like predicted oxidoreductase
MACTWGKIALGRSGVRVSPLGLGASYGLGGADLERAFERGVNLMYWGARRTPGFAEGVTAISQKHREDLVLVVQTFARETPKVRESLESALTRLPGAHYADFLLLGMWDQFPPEAILDEARECQRAGLARKLMVSVHHRATCAQYIACPDIDAIMVRYNAAHDGAERDVFPLLGDQPPGIVAFTATRWGELIDPTLVPTGEVTPRGSDCYRFALSHPGVHACVAGPKNGSELDEAMAALDRGPMTADELAWMRRIGKAVYAQGRERPASRSMPGSTAGYNYE